MVVGAPAVYQATDNPAKLATLRRLGLFVPAPAAMVVQRLPLVSVRSRLALLAAAAAASDGFASIVI